MFCLSVLSLQNKLFFLRLSYEREADSERETANRRGLFCKLTFSLNIVLRPGRHIFFVVVLKYLALYTVKGKMCRDLRNHGNKDDKNEKGLISNATTLHVLYTFCYITLSLLHA